jgi:hypothetical protein
MGFVDDSQIAGLTISVEVLSRIAKAGKILVDKRPEF